MVEYGNVDENIYYLLPDTVHVCVRYNYWINLSCLCLVRHTNLLLHRKQLYMRL